MRISDWSSDVCSSDLVDHGLMRGRAGTQSQLSRGQMSGTTKKFKKQKGGGARHGDYRAPIFVGGGRTDRKSVVKGKRVAVRVDIGGRRIIKKKKQTVQSKSRRNTMTLKQHTIT